MPMRMIAKKRCRAMFEPLDEAKTYFFRAVSELRCTVAEDNITIGSVADRCLLSSPRCIALMTRLLNG
jgi:hypothetical protein